MSSLELKVPPIVVSVVFIVFMSLLAQYLPLGLVLFPIQSWLAIALFIAGIGVAIAGVLAFNHAQTTVDPTDPNKASAIVDSGIYAYTRNPMYLGMGLVLCGYAVDLSAISSYLSLILFLLYMTRYQIVPEERVLTEKFGQPYQDYLQRVRRWL
jgi:protein-S-isoprenylcysteine O-methyltransferase Ste14